MILNDSWNFNLKTKLTSEAHDKKVVSFLNSPKFLHLQKIAFLPISTLFRFASQLQENHKED